jgi:hypothetical protein
MGLHRPVPADFQSVVNTHALGPWRYHTLLPVNAHPDSALWLFELPIIVDGQVIGGRGVGSGAGEQDYPRGLGSLAV